MSHEDKGAVGTINLEALQCRKTLHWNCVDNTKVEVLSKNANCRLLAISNMHNTKTLKKFGNKTRGK